MAELARISSVEQTHDLEAASRVFNMSVQRLVDAPEFIPVLPGSMLAMEDGCTARKPLSTQVQMAFARSQDALEAFRDLTVQDINSAAVLRPFAHYSLIRMACEAASLGFWLLRPGAKAKRVLRSLNLEYTHYLDSVDLEGTLTGRRRKVEELGSDSVVVRLNELKDTVSQLREMSLSRIPRWSDILVDASPTRPPQSGHSPASPFVVWKVASAFLHGSSDTVRVLSDLEQLTDFGDDGIASVEMRPSWRVLSGCFAVCVQLLYDVEARYRELATHDYAHRPLIGA